MLFAYVVVHALLVVVRVFGSRAPTSGRVYAAWPAHRLIQADGRDVESLLSAGLFAAVAS